MTDRIDHHWGDRPKRNRGEVSLVRMERMEAAAARRRARVDALGAMPPAATAPSWTPAAADLPREGAGQGRDGRLEIREERLRTTAGLKGTPAVALSAWRGRSGRRYVVGVHGLDADVFDAPADCFFVVLAIVRDDLGTARPLGVARIGQDFPDSAIWLARMARAGATELHWHRLAQSAAEAEAVVMDLTAQPDA